MTPEELENKWSNLTKELEDSFYPLLIASKSALSTSGERIFVDGLNTAGQDMLTRKPYSTKPTYIDVDKSPRKNLPFKTGKTGKEIKSYYFPNGYSQFKNAISRPVLELSLQLRNGWYNSDTGVVEADLKLDRTKLTIGFTEDRNAQVAEALQKDSQYGQIFGFTQEELDQLTLVLEGELAKAYNE